MGKYKEVVLKGKDKPNITHQRGTGANFKYKGGPLQAAPSREIGNTDTSATGDDCR